VPRSPSGARRPRGRAQPCAPAPAADPVAAQVATCHLP
jgi:hypothetical protein